jgi:hypothetical protein
MGRLGEAMRRAKQALADAQRVLAPGDPPIPELHCHDAVRLDEPQITASIVDAPTWTFWWD